jgi:hypothetical protein
MRNSPVSITGKNTLRLLIIFSIILLLIPVGIAAVSQPSAKIAGDKNISKTATNVTFITTQGGARQIYPNGGKAVAVQTETKKIIWQHDKYRRYMDIDPIGTNKVLLVAEKPTGDTYQRVAVLLNWRTGVVINEFDVPQDTHDIDFLGQSQYAIADKQNDRVYVYNSTTDSIIWKFDFHKHFPESAGGKPNDWTHLNDIDVANNGTEFVVSPRNFDRVMAINRSTKKIMWTLGKEDAHTILYEQHNPVVLRQDPLTVLVADSENNRIVEYQFKDGKWRLTWGFRGGLYWPRDADRLPNGNTLISDTHNDRVLEVTPDHHIVWQYHIERGTYDVERLKYGDEPSGPTMTSMQNKFKSPFPTTEKSRLKIPIINELGIAFKKIFQIVTWILPEWVTINEFGYLLTASVIFLGWGFSELMIALPLERIARGIQEPKFPSWLMEISIIILLLMGTLLLFLLPISGSQTIMYLVIGVLLIIRSFTTSRRSIVSKENGIPTRLQIGITMGLSTLGICTAGVVLIKMINDEKQIALAIGLSLLLILAIIDLIRKSNLSEFSPRSEKITGRANMRRKK